MKVISSGGSSLMLNVVWRLRGVRSGGGGGVVMAWMRAIVLRVVDPVRLNTMTLIMTGYFQAPCAAIAFASGR